LVKTVSMPAIGSGFLDAKDKNKVKPMRDSSDSRDEDEEQDEPDDKKDVDEAGDSGEKEKEAPDHEKELSSFAGPIKGDEEDNLVAEKIYNNYFSVGVDAKVALDFHIARESNPEGFKSRNYNKFKYFQYGAVSVLGGCRDLNKKMTVLVDGKEVKIPNSVEGVVALNLTSYASGTNPWKNSKPAQEWAEQRIDDGLLEVVGVNGTLHLGQIRTGLSTGVQIGQGKEVVFILKEALPVQADGEPWLQQPARMIITLHNKTKMLQRPQAPSVLGRISPWFKKTGRRQTTATGAKEHNEFGVDVVEEEAPRGKDTKEEHKDIEEGGKGKEKEQK